MSQAPKAPGSFAYRHRIPRLRIIFAPQHALGIETITPPVADEVDGEYGKHNTDARRNP